MILPVTVMNLPRAIKAQPDEKVVPLEELAPFIGQARAVRLEGVRDLFPAPEGFLKFHNFSEKLNAEQRRLTPVPDKLHDRSGLRIYIPGNVRFKDLIGHPHVLPFLKEGMLFKIKTVVAFDVAGRPNRFCQHMHPW
jgi:hypothetical protein